jgi:hypothetical protein
VIDFDEVSGHEAAFEPDGDGVAHLLWVQLGDKLRRAWPIASRAVPDGEPGETDGWVLEWEKLLDLVADALRARAAVGGIDGVERVGLRYVDEIRVPDLTPGDWAPWLDPTLIGLSGPPFFGPVRVRVPRVL